MSTNTIPSDTPSVFDALTSNGSISAIAYPSPFPSGIAGLVFDWTGEERLELRAEVTDSWVEDNTAVNDQMALNPERFILNASTAEIVFNPAAASSAPPQPANPFPLNSPMVPQLTPGAQAAQVANSAPSAAAAQGTTNLYQYYLGLQANSPSRQATIVGFIYQLWKGRVLFTVETPWGIFDSMVIELADAVQSEETTGRTDHKITFKKFRIVQDGALTPDSLLGRAFNQASEADPNLNGNVGQTTYSDQQSQQLIGNWTLLGSAGNN
jgi:hypothetical protein